MKNLRKLVAAAALTFVAPALAAETEAVSPTDTLTQGATGPAFRSQAPCDPPPASKQLGAQVFFRGGGGFLTNSDRGGEVYVDAGAARSLRNDDTAGYSFGFGFHLPLMKDPLFGNTVLGEVAMDYSRFSNKTVVPVTSVLLGAPKEEKVPVTQFVVAGSPKYRFDGLDKFRPWFIPVGMAMMVNSPPTDKSTYLDIGLQFGVGADYRLTESMSLGVDCRYFYNLIRPNGSWLTTGAYIGFDF